MVIDMNESQIRTLDQVRAFFCPGRCFPGISPLVSAPKGLLRLRRHWHFNESAKASCPFIERESFAIRLSAGQCAKSPLPGASLTV